MEVLGIIALCAFIWWKSKSKNKFAALGNIAGVPIKKIVKQVGQPSSISSTGDGQLYQWIETSGFFFVSSHHFAILVDEEEKAVGYTHQFVS